ncbi:MAG: PaaI family thioesterase [Bacteroidales bacterium]|nr:PaaI family thioesterase [Bacteroidales bacterium]
MMSLEEIKKLNEGTMMETLGIEYIDVKEGYVCARMMVRPDLSQPYGMLHGGASMALAESIGGVGSAFYLGIDNYIIRGMQMSANHVKAAKVGTYVYATATIIHKGRQTHVWNIDIKNEDEELVSTCRLTNFILVNNVQCTMNNE